MPSLKKPNYFDIHSHLNFSQYDEDREEVVKSLEENDVWTTTVGTNLKTSKEAVDLALTSPNLFATIGIHPGDSEKEDWNEEEFASLVENSKVLAIGECGLDYFRGEDDFGDKTKKQKELFEKQIQFALKYDKPLMIHCRNAYGDVYDILQSYSKEYGEKLRGDMHFFAGSTDVARRFLDINFMISFTGVITFTEDYNEAVKFIPIEKMMAETDSPFVAPTPYRGSRNNPLNVKEVVNQIAIIRQENMLEVRETLTSNALNFFKIDILDVARE